MSIVAWLLAFGWRRSPPAVALWLRSIFLRFCRQNFHHFSAIEHVNTYGCSAYQSHTSTEERAQAYLSERVQITTEFCMVVAKRLAFCLNPKFLLGDPAPPRVVGIGFLRLEIAHPFPHRSLFDSVQPPSNPKPVNLQPWSAKSATSFSPPSPSTRATPTSFRTRSPMPSSTPASRPTPSPRSPARLPPRTTWSW